VIKDWESKMVLHHSKVEGGLYPLKFPPRKQVLSSIKVSFDRWHYRLGHPAPSIVQRVLRDNNLSVDVESIHESVCGACQKGKMYQLPYPKSS
jgi:hypothetical protein